MAKQNTSPKKTSVQPEKLNFLIGKWHAQGEIVQGASVSSKDIRRTETYEWVSGGFFIVLLFLWEVKGQKLLKSLITTKVANPVL